MRKLFQCFLLFAAVWPANPSSADDGVTWQASATDSTIVANNQGRTVGVYQSKQKPLKPYLEQLITPGGQQVLLDSPADHVHHHGLMFALSVDDVSFWEESESGGTQNVRETNLLSDGSLSQSLRWVDPQGNEKLNERRRIHLSQTADATRLTWQSTLTVPNSVEKVALGGSHYYGLGMRLVQPFDSAVTFRFPDKSVNEPVRGTEKLTRANWVACVGNVNGKPVTVAMFSHPANNRHPAWWFTMDEPFAYQAATFNLWKDPITLHRGDEYAIKIGVAVFDGDIDTERIESIYSNWTNNDF